MSGKIEVTAEYEGGYEKITADSIKEVNAGLRLRDEDGYVIGFVTYENLAYAKPAEE